MPPFLPRKRLNSTPPATTAPTPAKRAKLADVLDAESRNTPGIQKPKVFSLESDDSDSSLSDVDSEEFEDVPTTKKDYAKGDEDDDDDDDDEDEDIEWEDAGAKPQEPIPERQHLADGPIELVFRKDDTEIDYGAAAAASNKRKGASKREKEARIRTHQMHVQFLLWHNSIRNRWISDKWVQQVLVQQLPPQIKKEIDSWRRASGLSAPETADRTPQMSAKRRGKQKRPNPRNNRDWGRPSQPLEPGKANMSHGDPLIPLLKVLALYWKKRFAITAPGLRKRGYGTKLATKQLINSFRNDEHDPEEHGERIRNLTEFREGAKKCEGSRDLGAQLFTALLRAIGIESRLVASLQPSGFGWTKAEQMLPKKAAKAVIFDTSDEDSDDEDAKSISEITKEKARVKSKTGRKSGRNNNTSKAPIELNSDTDLSSNDVEIKDDDSLVDVTPSMPKKRPQKYDRDNPFPIYWTEVISPITNKVLPVSALILNSPVASSPEVLATFEPRGAKAEKTKTIIAYIVAYSSDGTAKDVTVRYIRNRIWPGKTKGFRFPVEKIPVYNKHGKVKRYEEFDWFKRTMSGYERPDVLWTAVDDIEDSSDLVPQVATKKEVNDDVDTLQSLKASADFVLERFLRREEALRPEALSVRTFASGKGDNLKEEPVYRRSDVERCLTAESWHKEGRRPQAGEAPMKLVPVRAVTLTRKREAEEHQRRTGEKQMQGLYSWDQTEYIIPPPIENGIIPKNAYGNIDCFVPTMVPRGAVHVPLRGTVRICKKLEIDFAEAVTGFEFGNKRAVPVCTGVVIAKEHEKRLRDAWTKFNEEQRKKEETKMEKLLLDLWRKFLMGLRIRERMQDTYGDVAEQEYPATGMSRDQPIALDDEGEDASGMLSHPNDVDEFGGGFLPDDDEDQPIPEELEFVHHEEPVETGNSKGKGRVADDYPTPLSVSPWKPAVQRQRKSLLQEDRASESSELSSATEESEAEVFDDDDTAGGFIHDEDGNSSATISARGVDLTDHAPRSSRRKPGRDIATSATKQRRARKAISPTPSEQASSQGIVTTSPSDSDNVDDTEDDYRPTKSSAPKISKATPARKTKETKAKKNQPKASVKGEDEDSDDDVVVTPKSKRTTRRSLRRDSTVVTSPYF